MGDRNVRRRRCRGNIKPAPFAITPDVVARVIALTTPRPAPRVIDVPILPVKLVDRPRRSEDPRLAKANDDIPEQRKPADAGEGCQPGRVARPEEPSDPSFPPVVGGSDVLDAEPKSQIAKSRDPKADHAGGFEGRTPEGTSGVDLGSAHAPANARQPRKSAANGGGHMQFDAPRRPDEPLRNQARKRDVMYRNRVNAEARELELPVDHVVERARLIREEADQIARRVAPKPQIDWSRVVAAHRAKSAKGPKAPPAPTEHAPNREECPRCGIPGWKGCAHYLPCEELRIVPDSADDYMKGGQGQKPNRRSGAFRKGLRA